MGNPTAGILMLLVGVALLMMFVTGRLDWLTRLTQETRAVQQGSEPQPAPAAAAAITGVRHPAVQPRPSTA
ncbi:MAG: hypothetical protein IT352_15430 [Gemmatimonadales bacterium]|nr:hypothetical protein [Gemmatimonadales bacterium]